ncbi:MAG: hypothetical protein IT343_07190 [Candidatus Melainabacteria bacterium]|nr:hypothetical protein [Candidatus Melainabacteria bacterium]
MLLSRQHKHFLGSTVPPKQLIAVRYVLHVERACLEVPVENWSLTRSSQLAFTTDTGDGRIPIA